MRLVISLMFLVFWLLVPAHAQGVGNPGFCKQGSKRIVPNIMGMSIADAQAAIESCDLKWSYSNNPGTMSYEAIGSIGDQVPKGGEIVAKDGTVRGFRSNGFYLPNFLEWHETSAVLFTKDLRLGVNVTYRRDAAAAGTVIEQSPANAELFNSGLPLNLVVSEGPWVEVPNLIDKQYHPSVKQLSQLGLKPVHGGGSLESGERPITNCEIEVWYPVVERLEPGVGSKIFEGDAVRVFAKTRRDFLFIQQPGQLCQ